MTPIRIENVSKFFGKTPAVDGVSLDIAAGELFFLLGPSGCGKTTLLRILAGFIQPDAGGVYFADKAVTHLRPQDRDAGMVFQTYALWPHMTVAGNVAYGLHVRGVRRQEVATRVGEALKLVRMDGFEERRPTQLSGGQQQRVALARALVIRPQVLLLDEPLSNLDARLRDEMREEIRRLHEQTKLTMVYVTHDQKEALTLADRLAVMERGRLVQVGKPQEVYNRPLSRFVAGFLGDSNFVVGTVREYAGGRCLVETALGTLAGMPAQAAAAGQQVVCSIRPHALALGQHGTGANQITGKVQQVSYLGEVLHVKVAAGGDTLLDVVSLAHLAGQLRAGDPVSLSVPEDQVVILPDTN